MKRFNVKTKQNESIPTYLRSIEVSYQLTTNLRPDTPEDKGKCREETTVEHDTGACRQKGGERETEQKEKARLRWTRSMR